MYLGRIVEICTFEEVLLKPQHPYTRALLSVLPDPARDGPPILLSGEPPDPTAIPAGCRFHPRCPAAAAAREEGDERAELCPSTDLAILPGQSPERAVACHLASRVPADVS
jgi:oligopeptide/dipeptide ABC transporter ATP-binding protein